MLAKHAVDGGAGCTVALRHLAQAVSAVAVPQDGGVIKLERLAPDMTAFEPSAAHPGPAPLDDEIALQLGDGADDDHDRPT